MCSVHWRCQLYGTVSCAPSTSHCLIFLVTSELHKLWHWTLCGLGLVYYSETIYWPNILACTVASSVFIAWIFCESPLNYFLLVSCPSLCRILYEALLSVTNDSLYIVLWLVCILSDLFNCPLSLYFTQTDRHTVCGNNCPYVLCSHVFLGFSRDGQFVFSYTMLVDTSTVTFTYRLQCWLFTPRKPLRMVLHSSCHHHYIDSVFLAVLSN